MRAQSLFDAFELPPSARVEQRIPKNLLLERGAPTAADRRHIRNGVERLTWSASLKPSTIAIPAYSNDAHDYLEIHVVVATLRDDARPPRLIELLHRSIPYPLALCVEQSTVLTLSLAHKRKSQGEVSAVVLERLAETPNLAAEPQGADVQSFLTSLALSTINAPNLFALYQAWFERVVALEAAVITGSFVLPETPERAASRAAALIEYARLDRDLSALRARAKRERQLSRRVELNLAVKRLESELMHAVSSL